MPAPETPQQQLEWEARQRPRAAVASVIAGILVFAGQTGQQILFQGLPDSSLIESFQRAQQPGPISKLPSLQTPAAQWLSDHTFWMLVSFFAEAIGSFALAYALTFLAAATKARRERFPKVALYLPVIGGVLVGMAAIGRGVGRALDVSSFLDGPRTVGAAQDIGLGGLSLVSEVIYYPASLALAAGIVMVSLQAMRAGLLTRFLGILGVIVGALQVIRIGPLPLVQTFWFLALAVLFAGGRPSSEPPAWRTGREEPWPSQQELAETRAKQRADRRPAPKPELEPVPAGGASSRAASKRKRKRRH